MIPNVFEDFPNGLRCFDPFLSIKIVLKMELLDLRPDFLGLVIVPYGAIVSRRNSGSWTDWLQVCHFAPIFSHCLENGEKIRRS